MSEKLVRALIHRTSQVIAEHAEMLTELDSAIGDGDHGINMKRGFEAIATKEDALAGLPLGEALQRAGMILVTSVGGASGPLYGSLLMGMGKALRAGADAREALREGIELVRKRGRSDRGCKTMLDVLIPVSETLDAQQQEQQAELLQALRRCADEALEATREMVATRGRASFLGERSKGHLDPGAASSRLLVQAVCDVLEHRQ